MTTAAAPPPGPPFPRETVPLWRITQLRHPRVLLWTLWVVLPLVIALALVALPEWVPPRRPAEPPASVSVAEWQQLPSRAAALALLATLPVMNQRIPILGYERDCTVGACSFGPAWSDDTTAPDSHNGRNTRDDMLRRVRSSRDAYTGRPLPNERRLHHVDHVFPLAAAWDLGAWSWSAAQRARFANDTALNLVVVGAAINTDKSDSTPGDWLPPWRASHCWYATKYLRVASVYQLALTPDDVRALRHALHTCPQRH